MLPWKPTIIRFQILTYWYLDTESLLAEFRLVKPTQGLGITQQNHTIETLSIAFSYNTHMYHLFTKYTIFPIHFTYTS